MTQVARLTISLPKDLILFADKVARGRKISRSKVIASCLREAAERQALAELEEGYRVMAEENRKLAQMTFELQRSAVPEWN